MGKVILRIERTRNNGENISGEKLRKRNSIIKELALKNRVQYSCENG